MVRKAQAQPDPVDEDEFETVEEDGDLEELEDEEPTETPKKTRKKPSTEKAQAARAATAPKFGSAQLAAHVTELTGDTYDARGIRMLLRKLANDGKLERVVGETRDRYSFTGPDDPAVKAIVAMVKSGEAKALKQAGLDKVKAAAEEKRAAKKAAKAAAEAEASETDEDEEVEEEVEETPKPTTRRRAAKPAAPAKATPSRRRQA